MAFVVNFTDAPPASGRAPWAKVPSTDYLLQIVSAEHVEVASGGDGWPADKVTVRFAIADGDYVGKEVQDTFTISRNPQAKKFPLQRLHLLLIATGRPDMTNRKFNFDPTVLVEKYVYAHLVDKTLPANTGKDGKEYPETEVSAPQRYDRLPDAYATAFGIKYTDVVAVSKNGTGTIQHGTPQKVAAPAPAPAAPKKVEPPVTLEEEEVLPDEGNVPITDDDGMFPGSEDPDMIE